jgi:hypothetical protein
MQLPHYFGSVYPLYVSQQANGDPRAACAKTLCRVVNSREMRGYYAMIDSGEFGAELPGLGLTIP